MRISPWWFSLAVVAGVSGWMASGLFSQHGHGTADAAPAPDEEQEFEMPGASGAGEAI